MSIQYNPQKPPKNFAKHLDKSTRLAAGANVMMRTLLKLKRSKMNKNDKKSVASGSFCGCVGFMGECPSHLFRSFWTHLCATLKPMFSFLLEFKAQEPMFMEIHNEPKLRKKHEIKSQWLNLDSLGCGTPNSLTHLPGASGQLRWISIRKMGQRRFDYYISKWYAHPTSKETLAFWLGMWPKTIHHPFFLDEAAASAMILCHAVWICSALRDLRTCQIDSIRISQSLEFHFIKLRFRKWKYMLFHVFFYSEFSKIKKMNRFQCFPTLRILWRSFVFNLQKKSCEYSLVLTIWSEKLNSQVLFFTFDRARWRSSRLRSFR